MDNGRQFKFISQLWKIIENSAKESESRMIPFGIFGLVAYLCYYLINAYLLNLHQYSDLSLRIFISFLCLLLVLKNYWPKKLHIFLPYYWYFTVLCSMPFFITFITLKNHGASAWVMNLVAIFILMMLLVDWINYIILLVSGFLLAWIVFILTTPSGFTYIPGTVTFKDIISTLVSSIIIGVIFSHNKEKVEKEKLGAMKLIAANIAHELRTPLAAIKAGASGIKDYLPDLLSTYEIAKQHKLTIPNIYPHQFMMLNKILNHVETETEFANTVINMLLVNVKQSEINQADFQICSISKCIDSSVKRYPFYAEDEKLIHWKKEDDFLFKGSELFTIHILFNLIKNSIYYIRAAGKGIIEVWATQDIKYNFLHFKDTGSGIDSSILPHIFDQFFSNTYHGYGVGLAFCRMVMRSYGGDIDCRSIKGEYTEFILKFPKIND